MSYFKESEFKCPCCDKAKVSAFLIHLLNKVRNLYGKPMIVNSGFRCEKHNKAVGGKPNSAHLRGTAADIKCTNSVDRYILVSLFFEAGFKRMGIYEDFIHVDVDEELPRPVLW